MFIKDGKRFNIYAPYTAEDGTRHTDLRDASLRAKYGITEIPDPVRESEETHFVQELDYEPYIINTPKPLSDVKKIAQARVKHKRDEIKSEGGCLVSGKWFHTDTDSKLQQMALVVMGAGIPNDLYWKTMDGSFMLMTQTLAAELFIAQATREQGLFALAESHIFAIEALENVNDILAYDYSSGWPQTFDEWQALQE